METYIMQIFNGLSVSSIYILAALGLVITFGLMKIINMSHGEFIMIGAYVTYLIQNLFIGYLDKSFLGLYFIMAIPASFIVAGLIGFILEGTVIRHLYNRPLDSILATWGVSLVLQQLARNIFGAPNVDVQSPSWLAGGLVLSQGLQLPYKRLFIIALVIACLMGMFVLLYKSKTGLRIRAVMQNREMAESMGINTRRVDALTFAIGSGLAGIAGCALTLLGSIGSTLGTNYIVDTFMVVVLGGVGTLMGTVAGGLLIGTANTILEFLTNTSLAKVLVFILIIAFLQWKPKGLFNISSRSLDE
ncbi:urea ABC transporter permease subunit UrtB [Desulfitobacterium sp.]|uniref:urea ABC transporter permease subunit UrtB n=1 Tax=Desulfitobacterium sp. TaxID=49981 RepID=UPI002C92E318|nr:urea ABC transporter permease subunit UrtB [Desulfitobacterium sp.]HVJ48937.1 urea ABC transporter permease subunit UrtB [Desulfitobacterium sp.]